MAPTPPPPTALPEFGLGAKPSPDDPLDHLFHVQDFLGAISAAPPPPRSHLLIPPFRNYDQDGSNQCVGAGGGTAMTIGDFPDEKRTVLFDWHELYCYVSNGGLAGCDIMSGTDARSMLDVLKKRGAKIAGTNTFRRIDAYSRLWGLLDIKLALAAHLPVLVVLKWPNSWFSPGKIGNRWFVPSPGSIAGLHLTNLVEYDDGVSTGAARIFNTYGLRWGDGSAWTTYTYLMSMFVEAWAIHDHIDSTVPPPAPTEADVNAKDWDRLGWTAKVKQGVNVADNLGHNFTTTAHDTYPFIAESADGKSAILAIDTGVGAPQGQLRHLPGYIAIGDLLGVTAPATAAPDPAALDAARKAGYAVALAEERAWAASRVPK